jgi:versiconal hemiacetal acetate esterase
VLAVHSQDEKIDENIKVRFYRPEQGSAIEKVPVGVYYHAGGFLLGNLNSDDAWCRYLAAHVRSIIVSVEYRLGPRYKPPIMIEDGYDAFNWVRETESSHCQLNCQHLRE